MSEQKIERKENPNGYQPTCHLRNRHLGGQSYVLEQLFQSIYVGEEDQWRQIPYVVIPAVVKTGS